jgi:hypothetical protein
MRHLDRRRARNEAFVESLMIPFAVIVLNVLRHSTLEMPTSEWNQPVQTFFFDRPHEAFRVRVGIRRARDWCDY